MFALIENSVFGPTKMKLIHIIDTQEKAEAIKWLQEKGYPIANEGTLVNYVLLGGEDSTLLTREKGRQAFLHQNIQTKFEEVPYVRELPEFVLRF